MGGGFLQNAAGKGATDCPPSSGGQCFRGPVMAPKQSFSLQVNRLKRRKDFLRVSQRGRKQAMPGLILQSFRQQPDSSESKIDVRVGFTVTKKIGNAITRNRVRRRLKAAAAILINTHAQENTDYVLIGRAGTLKRPFAFLVNDLKTAMQKLNLYTD